MALTDLNGQGTEQDPYIITDVDELQLIDDGLGASYKLGNDIDASATETWNAGEGFKPIALGESKANGFTGTFNGDGFEITNLHINSPSGGPIGLFSAGDGFTIKNVNLKGFNVTGSGGKISCLVGEAINSKITNVEVEGSIDGNGSASTNVGLVSGDLEETKIGNVKANGNISAPESSVVGGLIGLFKGDQEGPLMKNAKFQGSIEANDTAGGVLGKTSGESEMVAIVSECDITASEGNCGGVCGSVGMALKYSFSDSNVKGGSGPTGGLAGSCSSGVKYSKSHGKVESVGVCGGVAGIVNNQGMVSTCSSDCEVLGKDPTGSSTTPLGGLAGELMLGAVKESYCTGDVIAEGQRTVGGITGRVVVGQFGTSYTTSSITGGGIRGGIIGEAGSDMPGTLQYMGNFFVEYNDSLERSNMVIGKLPDKDNDEGLSILSGSDPIVSEGEYLVDDLEETLYKISVLSKSQLSGESAKENLDGFDFEDEWDIGRNYPKHSNYKSPFSLTSGKKLIILEVTEDSVGFSHNNDIYFSGSKIGSLDNGTLVEVIDKSNEYEISWLESMGPITVEDNDIGVFKILVDNENILTTAEGEGTEQNPYIINDLLQLQGIKIEPSSYYKLGSDIKAAGSKDLNSGDGFEPIKDFSGEIDGNGYEIAGLEIHRENDDGVGLLANCNNGSVVKDLSIINCTIEGEAGVGAISGKGAVDVINCTVKGELKSIREECGGLCGVNIDGIIDGCTSNCNIECPSQTGGIVGTKRDGVIIDCYFEGEINSTDNNNAGIGGSCINTTVKQCRTKGKISGGDIDTGGLAGQFDGSVMEDCYSKMSVESKSNNTGGAIGYCWESTVINSYSIGDVVSESNGTAGFVATATKSTIKECFSVGDVKSEGDRTAGFVGYTSDSNIIDCFCTGTVENSNGAKGGFVGFNNMDSTTENCYTTCEFKNIDSDTGGFVADNYQGDIINSYCLDRSDLSDENKFIGVNGDGTLQYNGSYILYSAENISEEYQGVNNSVVLSKAELLMGDAGGVFKGFTTPTWNFEDYKKPWLDYSEYSKTIPEGTAELKVITNNYLSEPLEDQSVFVNSKNIGKTNSEGFVDIEIPSGRTLKVVWANQSVEKTVEASSQEDVIVDFTNTKVTGRVTDVENYPVENDAIIFNNKFLIRTDENGEYQAEDIPPGEYTIRWPNGGVTETLDATNGGVVSRDFQYAGIDVTVKQPLVGSPIEGAIVDINNSIFRTDENGNVSVDKLPIDSYTVKTMGFWTDETGKLSEGELYESEFTGEDAEISVGVSVKSRNESKPVEGTDVIVTGAEVRAETNKNGNAELFVSDIEENPQVVIAKDDKRYKTEIRNIDASNSRYDLEFALRQREPMER